MSGLRQRGPDGFPVGADATLRNACGQIPDAEHFQHNLDLRYEKPVTVFGWQWSVTFGRWSALVEFSNGWKGYTWPESSQSKQKGASNGIQI